MRIGIGLNLLAPHNGGVTNYALTLMRHWPEFAPEHPLVLLSFAHNEPLLSTLPPESRRHELRLRTQEEAIDHLAAFDVYFCPFGTLWPRPLRKPSVLAFHDMQERFYPEFFTPAELAERFFHYDWSLRMADAVVAISTFTRNMAVDLAGTSPRACHIVHHAADVLPDPIRPENLPSSIDDAPFLFYPANFWTHKNHARLLNAFAPVARRHPSLRLVCTGSRLGRVSDWDGLAAATGVADRIHHLELVPRSAISWLYRRARGLIFPSLFEGFGIPLLEAMQCGCPIACGANTSQPEVAGTAALYFDAERESELSHAIERLAHDEPLRDRLRAAGTVRREQFTARRLVDGHVRAFASALRRHNRIRAWLNERLRLPRSLEERQTLTPAERHRAALLLQRHRHLPPGAERVSP